MTSVATVCFNDSHSISMDVESVTGIEMGSPIQVDGDKWFCELLVRSSHGTVAIQLLADSLDSFNIMLPDPIQEE